MEKSTKYIILILFTLLIGCEESKNNPIKEIQQKDKFIQFKPKTFPENNRLFLNFFKGMNKKSV